MSDFSVMTTDEKNALLEKVQQANAAAANAFISETNAINLLKKITQKRIYDRFGACVFCNAHKSFGCDPRCVYEETKRTLATFPNIKKE